VLYGENTHHMVEACYKGLARALRAALTLDPRKADAVPSTKGVLGGSL
jgi:imidazoleglycerol-phosphate dehydratase